MVAAPKELRANLRYRREVIKLGDSSAIAREEIILACMRDPLFFIDTFGFTYDIQNYSDYPERPLILWDHQERCVTRVLESLGKNGLLFTKSRRMGVTTLILAAMYWRWRFNPMQSFLLLSSKEDKVDNPSDPSCLMWKLDHFHACLPGWLRAPLDRADLRFGNAANGSVFTGESTNANADRGGVRGAVLADEVAAMKNADQVIDAVGPLTESLFLVSTPQGAFGGFFKMYEKWLVQAPERIVTLHWTMHEMFRRGLYFTDEAHTGYTLPEWNGRKPRSLWYDKECLKLSGPKRIAQELDIAWNEAGGRYFEEELVARLLKEARPSKFRGEVRMEGDEPAWLPSPSGRLLLWCPLGEARPPAGSYIVACDISLGLGGAQGSNSTISVVNAGTGEKVGEFKYNRIAPAEFARYVVGVCKWFHNAKLIWGRQGPGKSFAQTVREECRYYRIHEDKAGKAGYVEQGDDRQALFDGYRDALVTGKFRNPSEDAVKELRQFVVSSTQTIEHSSAMQSDDPENKGKLHGDIVISDALSCFLLKDVRGVAVPIVREPPYGSFLWAERRAERLIEDEDLTY